MSLRIIDNENEIVDPSQLADIMISNSDAELTEAYGLYIEGEFYGALANRNLVMQTFANMLKEYDSMENVSNVSFTKDIEYREGVYLADSIVSESSIISLITSKTQVEDYYIIEDGDSPLSIARKFDMSLLISLRINIKIFLIIIFVKLSELFFIKIQKIHLFKD